MKVTKIDESKLATTDDEYIALLSSNADWIIRSLDDLTLLRDEYGHPLSKLSKDSFDEFSKSLKFNGGGLGHANYKPLMQELSLTEIFEVFKGFGISPVKLLDYQDSYCSAPSTCSSRNFSVCTSTC